jgi:hypothetical protein
MYPSGVAEARKRKQHKPEKGKRTGPEAEAVIAEVAEEVEADADLTFGTAQERAQRDETIFRAWIRGVHPVTLAATYGLSERSIRRILHQQRNGARLAAMAKSEPLVAVDEYLWQIDGVIDELASVASREKGATRVSAILGRLAALKERRDVLQSVGVLPTDLRVLKQMGDLAEIAKAVLDVFRRYEVDAEAKAEVRRLLIEGEAQELPEGEPEGEPQEPTRAGG